MGFDPSTADRIDYNDDYRSVILNIGDILLTMTGEVGRICFVDKEKCLLNQRVLKIEGISRAYTYAYLKDNFQLIKNISKGSVQQNLSLLDLQKIKILNTLQEINEFKKYDYLIDNYISIKKENYKLEELKQLYLKKFFG